MVGVHFFVLRLENFTSVLLRFLRSMRVCQTDSQPRENGRRDPEGLTNWRWSLCNQRSGDFPARGEGVRPTRGDVPPRALWLRWKCWDSLWRL